MLAHVFLWKFVFRKFSMVPGQAAAISFSIGMPETRIGVDARVVLRIGNKSVEFGAVNGTEVKIVQSFSKIPTLKT